MDRPFIACLLGHHVWHKVSCFEWRFCSVCKIATNDQIEADGKVYIIIKESPFIIQHVETGNLYKYTPAGWCAKKGNEWHRI